MRALIFFIKILTFVVEYLARFNFLKAIVAAQPLACRETHYSSSALKLLAFPEFLNQLGHLAVSPCANNNLALRSCWLLAFARFKALRVS